MPPRKPKVEAPKQLSSSDIQNGIRLLGGRINELESLRTERVRWDDPRAGRVARAIEETVREFFAGTNVARDFDYHQIRYGAQNLMDDDDDHQEQFETGIAHDVEDLKGLIQLLEERQPATPSGPATSAGRPSVFMSYSFTTRGKNVARALRELLELVGFEVSTGESFEPGSIASKVQGRIDPVDIFIGVNTEARQSAWLRDEAAYAAGAKKPTFLLVASGLERPSGGIHGDIEYIAIPENDTIGEPFARILEGLEKIGFSFSAQRSSRGDSRD